MKWKKKFKIEKSFFEKKNFIHFFFLIFIYKNSRYFFIIFFKFSEFQFIQNKIIVFKIFYLLRKIIHIDSKYFELRKCFFFQNKFWKHNSQKKKFCYVVMQIKRHNFQNIMKLLSNFWKCTVINDCWNKTIFIRLNYINRRKLFDVRKRHD